MNTRPPETVPPPARSSGMTLIEVLVAMTIGTLVLGMTWSLFIRLKETIVRSTDRVNLHLTADTLRSALERDLAYQAPSLAVFARSQPSATATTREELVELVFMTTVAPLRPQASQGGHDQYLAEYHWVRWRFKRQFALIDGTWRTVSSGLYRSASTPTRYWTTTSSLTAVPPVVDPANNGTWNHYNGRHWINIPRPLRDASEGVESLDNNIYRLPASAIDSLTPDGDIGDLADLNANERLASGQVQDFMVSWVDASGTAHTLDRSSAADHRINGLYLDVTGPAGNNYATQLGARPQVVRIAIALAAPNVRKPHEFAFSFAAPGLPPQIAQPSP